MALDAAVAILIGEIPRHLILHFLGKKHRNIEM